MTGMRHPSASPLPSAFLTRMREWLGEEFDAFLASLTAPAARGLRVNTHKLTPDAFLARATFSLDPQPWFSEGFLVADPAARPGRHPYHAAGLYYLQDPSAMLAAHLLDPQPGEWVLDVSAAPGGKATHLAARLAGEGLLVANEVVRGRTRALIENLERFGAGNIVVTSEPVERLAEVWHQRFQRVLVDAPCSGEGMFRKSAAARAEWDARAIPGNAARQERILAAAAQTVAAGGRLLYATCTFAPEENEAVIARFLRTHPDFTLLKPPQLPYLDPGRPDWLPADLARDLPLERCIRVWPHRSPGDGHFFALMQREGEPAPPTPLAPPPSTLDRKTEALLRAFWEETLVGPWPEDGWIQYGDHIHRLPLPPAWWEPLRPVRAGLRVGRVARGRFAPHHALALSLRPDHTRQTLRLEAASSEARAYLRGETLQAPGPDGWLLVTVEDFPLGWGKRVRGVVKNHYPRALRWR
ncbi:MAG TPA: hypothetical protein EYP25_01340 [Anaerolineae bacterium]|nr:hypothetical protein [Anaerolineae bacterium]